MANLAIRGHETRGKEVIEILEMLGGENEHKLNGCNIECAYYEKNGAICNTSLFSVEFNNIFKLFTLEEFLEKFPYKVGDKVMTDDGDITNVVGMIWDNDINDVFYEIQICNEIFNYPKELLQPYKEETMEEKSTNHVYNVDDVDVISFDIAQKDIYQLDLKDNFLVILREGKYYVERIKPKYPKTYDECYNVLGYEPDEDEISCYNGYLIESFVKLLICRDAYWKIAGEQLGLDKPWKPNWNNDKNKYCIMNYHNNILKGDFTSANLILAFPTEEMRDAFYENFKDLIESCKELL